MGFLVFCLMHVMIIMILCFRYFAWQLFLERWIFNFIFVHIYQSLSLILSLSCGMLKLTGIPCMFPELLLDMVFMSAWASTQKTTLESSWSRDAATLPRPRFRNDKQEIGDLSLWEKFGQERKQLSWYGFKLIWT